MAGAAKPANQFKRAIMHKNWSTYSAFAVVIAASFMAQPTLASLFVLLFIIPLLMCLTIWLARHEGRKSKSETV